MRVKWTCSGCGAENISESNKRMLCYKCNKGREREGTSIVSPDTPLTISKAESKAQKKREKEVAKIKKGETFKKKKPAKKTGEFKLSKTTVRKKEDVSSFFTAIKDVPMIVSTKMSALSDYFNQKKKRLIESKELKKEEARSIHWTAQISDSSSNEAYIIFKPEES